MAKFYIQSGTVRAILDTDETQKAALWAVHRVMQQIAPVYEDVEMSFEDKQAITEVEGLLTLDDTIRISELGFDDENAQHIETYDVVVEWHQLMIAFDKLQRLL
jgi:hypothetical protein